MVHGQQGLRDDFGAGGRAGKEVLRREGLRDGPEGFWRQAELRLEARPEVEAGRHVG